MQQIEIVVRKALQDEAQMLAELGAETFFDAYVEQIEEARLAAYVAQIFGPELQAAELADPAGCFLLAEVEGEAVGYARLYQGTPPPNAGHGLALELQRIYVRQTWIGFGVGAALMRACLDEARARKSPLIWLGVWEYNQRAIRFYERWGFEAVGEQVFMMGPQRQRDVIMRLRLPDGGPRPLISHS